MYVRNNYLGKFGKSINSTSSIRFRWYLVNQLYTNEKEPHKEMLLKRIILFDGFLFLSACGSIDYFSQFFVER